MKTLVVFYSRSGNTKKVAEELASKVGAETEEIIDKRDRSGIKGFLTGGRDAIKKILTEIESPMKDPSEYELVVIGTPVWAGTMAPAIRTYIERYKKDLKKVAFFTTQGGKDEQKTFKDFEETVGLSPLAKMLIRAKEVSKGEYGEKLEDFIRILI